MFSGIVEAVAPVIETNSVPGLVRMRLQRPQSFDDLKIGDSVCCNGVCLTVESFDESQIGFGIAAETLQVTGWMENSLREMKFNLERSLIFGGRVHGHLVAGHVDDTAKLLEIERMGESLIQKFSLSEKVKPYVWEKGSVCINGVSLTVNEVNDDLFSICLIPETQERTNLSSLKKDDKVNIESDYFAKAISQSRKFQS